MTSTERTALTDLTTIADLWDDLREQLDTPTITSWPPAGITAYLAALDEHAREEYLADQAAERAERTALAPGERPVPLRLAVLDTIRALDATLLHIADQIASSVQRPARTAKAAGPGDDIGLRLSLAATADQADPRRWSWTGGGRDARTAALWLAKRLDGEAGPFRRLRPAEVDRIAIVAAGARQRIEKTLGLARREDPIPRPCHCGGELVMRQGGGQDPEVQCRTCSATWSGPALVQLLPSAA
ncbi:hypothetical protein [Kitasatospora sp. MBT66]|uniref:hypothetical protein n=1 Tax=Kitasatospora sp. MBT66 TaxID=1444769 RepID=UPI0006925E57|nr:hypothetical protein [Kitasatospora sp. MBT66]